MDTRTVTALTLALAVRAGLGAAQDPVFSDGFESGDLSAWDFAATGSGDLTVEAGAALAGTSFGLQAIVDDTVGLYVQDDTPADQSRYRARFYFDPSGFDPGEAQAHRRTRLFIAFEEAPTRRLLAIVLRRLNGEYAVMARVRRNDNSQANTPFFPITPGEHWVEIDWVRATTPEAADGWFQFSLDGGPPWTLTDLPNGAGAVDFVRLGALSVKSGASGVLLWDQFASRELTQIGPSLGPGGACTLPDQCGNATCVDGVCCQAVCPGACAACDVAGSLGTCTPIPSGQDPDAECGALSCAPYYWGWSGDNCLRRADVSAAQASCGGSGACRTAAQECADQPAGSTAVTCHADCQTPNLSTCTGLNAGICTNVNPGNSTCGEGPCRVTVPQCVNGAPNACTPNWGAATTETCNDLDDNCDGTVDNSSSFADGYESNNSCASYDALADIGSDQTITLNTLTIYPSGDSDYFRIDATETDNSCGCSFPSTDEDYDLKITLTVPAGAGSYRMCGGIGAVCGSFPTCVTVFAGSTNTITFQLDGTCSPFGGDDSYTAYVLVQGWDSPGFECRPYTLSYNFDAGHCR